ncbi:MAG: hypothetical protein ACI9DG_001159 [Oleispira sp.]|jgi:hypothetical protein
MKSHFKTTILLHSIGREAQVLPFALNTKQDLPLRPYVIRSEFLF